MQLIHAFQNDAQVVVLFRGNRARQPVGNQADELMEARQWRAQLV